MVHSSAELISIFICRDGKNEPAIITDFFCRLDISEQISFKVSEVDRFEPALRALLGCIAELGISSQPLLVHIPEHRHAEIDVVIDSHGFLALIFPVEPADVLGERSAL